jgi:hypothetical protein
VGQEGRDKWGQRPDELKKTITADTLTSLKTNDARGRIDRELTTLLPLQDRPPGMHDDSIASNVREVFAYFTERKGRRELPLK